MSAKSGDGKKPDWKSFFGLMVASQLFFAAQSQLIVAQAPAVKVEGVPACTMVDRFYDDEVWAKIGERSCLKCHNANGDAAESEFVLDESNEGKNNRTAFYEMAKKLESGQSVMLQKIVGELDHGGGEVVKKESTEFRILQRLVRRATGQKDLGPKIPDYKSTPFFENVEMISPRRLLRRVALSLVGRLPKPSEISEVEKNGLQGMDSVLDQMMQEEAFFVRLKEAFNDILLTNGYDGGGESALSYTHFHKSRLWYQNRDPNKNRKKENRLKYSHPEMRAYYKLVKNYRDGMRREPLELVAYIVKNDRPFTEFVTADYIMVSPYTARGYGIFEGLKGKFKNVDDPFEYIPTRLKALTNDSNGKTVQKSETGYFPHAGVLSTFQYLKRYPTTETNRNRLRVRMFFEHFLGEDILQLAPRVSDASAAAKEYKVPTMEAPDCVVCHRIIDPIAGLFQDFYALDGNGIFGPRKEGWYEDMFKSGLVSEEIEPDQKWRSLPWLGERTAKDPRFAKAMVQHVWYTLTGRKPMVRPEDIDDPHFNAKRRAYLTQRNEFARIAMRFSGESFNLKFVFKELVKSPFYRADGLATAIDNPRRLAELDEVGVARLLTPEQLERKMKAIFGSDWGRLTDAESKLGILYGGIDSKEITERNGDPSGAMGAVQRILANDMACRHVATDFSLPAKERRLFPKMEPDVVPGKNKKEDLQIRNAIVHLHELILGRTSKVDDPEIDLSFELFAGIVEEAKSQKGIDPRESYFCQSGREVTPRDKDPHYTIRAWRAVVTYLLRQHEFLYE